MLKNKQKFIHTFIADGPEDIDEDSITKEYKPDMCLFFILRNLEYYYFVELELPMKALLARLPKCREEAINILKKNKRHWNDEIVDKIKEAAELEPNDSINKRMNKLLFVDYEDSHKKCE